MNNFYCRSQIYKNNQIVDQHYLSHNIQQNHLLILIQHNYYQLLQQLIHNLYHNKLKIHFHHIHLKHDLNNHTHHILHHMFHKYLILYMLPHSQQCDPL